MSAINHEEETKTMKTSPAVASATAIFGSLGSGVALAESSISGGCGGSIRKRRKALMSASAKEKRKNEKIKRMQKKRNRRRKWHAENSNLRASGEEEEKEEAGKQLRANLKPEEKAKASACGEETRTAGGAEAAAAESCESWPQRNSWQKKCGRKL